jgi:hypothetical protein
MRHTLLLPMLSCLAAACGLPPAEYQAPHLAVSNDPIEEPMPPVPRPPTVLRVYGIGNVERNLRLALAGTEIQLTSYEDSSTLRRVGYSERETVCNPPPGAVAACRQACIDAGGGLAQIAYCTEGCDAIGCSYNTCVQKDSPSFVAFGEPLRDLSTPLPSEPTNCNSTTCPACAPPARTAALRDLHLPVPAARVNLWYETAVCSLRWMKFSFLDDLNAPNLQISSDNTGIQVVLTGEAPNPTVTCANAPNLLLGPKVKVTFAVKAVGGRLKLTPTVAYIGWISASQVNPPVLLWVIQFFESWIRDAINDQVRTALQGETAKQLSAQLDAVVRAGLDLSSSTWITEAFTRSDGIHVRYLP